MIVTMKGGPHDNKRYVVPSNAAFVRVDDERGNPVKVPIYASGDGIVVIAKWEEREDR